MTGIVFDVECGDVAFPSPWVAKFLPETGHSEQAVRASLSILQ